MRARTLGAILICAALLPLAPAAANHCTSNIYLFPSTRGAGPYEGAPVLTPSAACIALGEDPDLDVIYPGSDYWQVRWLINEEPVSGTLVFGGQTIDLQFRQGVDIALRPATWWDSQWFPIDPADTVDGGNATILVCLEEGFCDVRIYRTVL